MIWGAAAIMGSAGSGSSVPAEAGTSGFSGRTGMVTGTETSSASSPLGSVWSRMTLGVSMAWGSLAVFVRDAWKAPASTARAQSPSTTQPQKPWVFD